MSKWVVTRTLDTLEKLNIVERLENRKTVLTVPGVKLAEKYQKQTIPYFRYCLGKLRKQRLTICFPENLHHILLNAGYR